MAAQEEQRQRVVMRPRRGLPFGPVARRFRLCDQLLATTACDISAQLVDQPPGRHGHEPRPRVVGHSLGRPLNRRGEQSLLESVLALGELRVAADEDAEDLGRQRAQKALELSSSSHISTPPMSMIGRTSSGAKRELGHRTAISTARSMLSQSTIK